MPSEAVKRIASILRTDIHTIDQLRLDLEKATGKFRIFERIIEENEALIRNRLDFLGLGRGVNAFEVYDALISKVECDDLAIFQALDNPDLNKPSEARRILDLAAKISNNRTGFFLKKETAAAFLEKEPPKKILEALGYRSVKEMLAKEDLLEVFSGIRFLEDPEWLNKVFFRQYENLKPADFEERSIAAKVLDRKWAAAAEKFTKKKHHNVSHLKELGVIFVIPVSLGVSGETLRLLSLLTHYFNEIHFYSELFKQFVNYEDDFAKSVISLLRGDIIEGRLPVLPAGQNWPRFLIIQRYLAKDDVNDWRLFEPHVNPEAVHWKRAEDGIVHIGDAMPQLKDGLHFWGDLDWVGDFFKDDTGNDLLVSFNLVDTVMALVKEKEMIKYLYHHQEALWNKIFTSYFSEARMLALMQKHILKGWFEA